MKGKLSLGAVAVAFAMLALPGTASAHVHKHSWAKMDCALFGWMDHGRCHKAVKHKHRHKHVHKKADKTMK